LSTLKIPTARIFEPLLARARYKGAHGGRGSGNPMTQRIAQSAHASQAIANVELLEIDRTVARRSANSGAGRYQKGID
jgi:phage terminase large subunit